MKARRAEQGWHLDQIAQRAQAKRKDREGCKVSSQVVALFMALDIGNRDSWMVSMVEIRLRNQRMERRRLYLPCSRRDPDSLGDPQKE